MLDLFDLLDLQAQKIRRLIGQFLGIGHMTVCPGSCFFTCSGSGPRFIDKDIVLDPVGLGHGRRSADDGVVGVELHRDDELGVAAALLGIDPSVGFERVVFAAAELDGRVSLAAFYRDLVAADVGQTAAAAAPAEPVRCINTILQTGGIVDGAGALSGVILPLGDFVSLFVIFEFGLGPAGLAGIFLLFSGFDAGSVFCFLGILAVENDPLVGTPRIGLRISVTLVFLRMRRDRKLLVQGGDRDREGVVSIHDFTLDPVLLARLLRLCRRAHIDIIVSITSQGDGRRHGLVLVDLQNGPCRVAILGIQIEHFPVCRCLDLIGPCRQLLGIGRIRLIGRVTGIILLTGITAFRGTVFRKIRAVADLLRIRTQTEVIGIIDPVGLGHSCRTGRAVLIFIQSDRNSDGLVFDGIDVLACFTGIRIVQGWRLVIGRCLVHIDMSHIGAAGLQYSIGPAAFDDDLITGHGRLAGTSFEGKAGRLIGPVFQTGVTGPVFSLCGDGHLILDPVGFGHRCRTAGDVHLLPQADRDRRDHSGSVRSHFIDAGTDLAAVRIIQIRIHIICILVCINGPREKVSEVGAANPDHCLCLASADNDLVAGQIRLAGPSGEGEAVGLIITVCQIGPVADFLVDCISGFGPVGCPPLAGALVGSIRLFLFGVL